MTTPTAESLASPPTVSVIIATRNRETECRQAIRSLLIQTWQPLTIVIYDDASDSVMSQRLADLAGQVQWVRNDSPRGATGCRKLGMNSCWTDYLLSIDDDCWLSTSDIVALAVKEIETHPNWAAVALPLVEPDRLPDGHPNFATALQTTPAAEIEMRSFLGGSVMFRMSAVRQVGGVRDAFEMLGGDEADLALRFIAQGWKIGYVRSAPVVHTVSPSRDRLSKFYFDARSAILCDALNLPFPDVFWSMIRHSIQLLTYRLTLSNFGIRIRGVAAGWWAAVCNLRHRKPLINDMYRYIRKLPRHGIEPCPPHLRSSPDERSPVSLRTSDVIAPSLLGTKSHSDD